MTHQTPNRIGGPPTTSSRPAAGIRVGDEILWQGVEQAVEVILHDEAGVSIQTDKSGEGNWIATFSLDEAVEVPATACPAWCSRDAEWHEYGDPVHATRFEVITTGCLPGCRYHDTDAKSQRNADAWVSLERADDDDKPGQMMVSLNVGTLTGESHFTPDQADKLAAALLRLVAAARDNTPVIKADTTTDI